MTTAPLTKLGRPSNERRHAESLWQELRNGLLQTEETLKSIIREKAWEPLGYSSFAEAWRDRMSDILIATELRPQIIYRLFDEKLSDSEIAETVKGVTPEKVKNLRREKESGVPANLASGTPARNGNDENTIIIRPHERKVPPSAHDTLHLKFTPEEITWFQEIATNNNGTVDEIAKTAVLDAFNRLSQKKGA